MPAQDELMNGSLEQRTYTPAEVVAFRKTNEPFGGLSNMAPGFPVVVNRIHFGRLKLFISAAATRMHPMFKK